MNAGDQHPKLAGSHGNITSTSTTASEARHTQPQFAAVFMATTGA